ncbi:hypothetical protein F5888DRAFT_1630006 [Russula emetica]|nr:hypothetical protein F5888DRAFT_1630006 [Russula emetica]
MVDTQVRVLPLAHPFVCNDSELPDRMPLYVTFQAARQLLNRIKQDAVHILTSPPPRIPGSCRRLANVHDLLRVSGNNGQVGERMGFQITQKLETGLEGRRLLYLATSDHNQEQILLKFSRRYSKDLHEFCASVDHAPELLAFERLPGGWFGVAMKYYPLADRILESKRLCDHGETWLKDINNVVERFHAQGYVHGDLRPPNFIVNGDKLLLVDFDWGRKEGEATFPRRELHSVLRDSRQDTRITQQKDTLVKEYTKRLISGAINQAHVRSGLPSSS